MTIRVGFYGTGLISQMHRFFLADSRVDHEVVAVHDPDADRAADAAASLGAVAVGEDELLDLVDAVYVTTWTSEHPRLVEKIAARGLAVFCEKPLAVDAATAQHMVDVVTEAGVVNQVGLILRSWAPFPLLRDLIRDERAGQVLAVVFRDDQYIPNQGHYASTWRVDASKAGRGTLLEHSIHDVDILQWMLGPVRSVSGVVREVHGHPRIDDVAAARLEFESGAVAQLTSIWHDILERPSLRRVEVFCERLHAVIEGDLFGPVRWQYTGEPEEMVENDGLIALCRDRGLEIGNTARSFLQAVEAGRPASPDFAEALPAHRLVDAIYASADAGGVPVDDPLGARAPT
jgi:predicted dehydrogenase